jgi:hypothetical protein
MFTIEQAQSQIRQVLLCWLFQRKFGIPPTVVPNADCLSLRMGHFLRIFF